MTDIAACKPQQLAMLCKCLPKRTTLFFLESGKLFLPQAYVRQGEDLRAAFDGFISSYFTLDSRAFRPIIRTLAIGNGDGESGSRTLHLAVCPMENQIRPPHGIGWVPVKWANRGELQGLSLEDFSEETCRLLQDPNVRSALFDCWMLPTGVLT